MAELIEERTRVSVFWAAAERHRVANLEAAKIIIQAPQRYAGALTIWAQRVLNRERASGDRRVAAA